MKELSKVYEAKKYEDMIYKRWEESGFFNPDVCIEKGIIQKDAPYFSIVLPPPNVTGTLHMGHAAMLAIEDVMVRYHRMKGDRTLWVPGTDHAAVATESKVEAKLIKEEKFKKPKQELGREKFLERVEQFAKDSHDTIVNQCKKMGASLDWSREAYTLDEQRSLAVRTVFKKMYEDGLIYRGYRVINWSVKGQSTCSDDELVYVERPAKLYYFKYSKDFPITIATTRPETKLGDTAVAVNPKDKRYKKFIGKTFTVDVGAVKPLNLKIIGHDEVDPDFGTGALGVTPAHSVIDFAMYEKQKAAGDPIELIQVIGEDGKMTEATGKDYIGLTVEEAREKFVTYLRKQNLLEKEEDITQNVGTSDRFGDVVEALPKTQWFVDVQKKVKNNFSNKEISLKEMMQSVVKNGDIKIVPDRFEKTYFHWIDNLRDWCISRQIWFGHQIPVWYKGDEVWVGLEAPEGSGWQQDPDTLDTWFSSGLWTFSTLGWPSETKDLQIFHPNSILETGYDILFFWVARMILMTTYTLGTVPFKTVYLHGLVRDEKGRKMSKSLGNIINPLDMIEKYGTDAVRLSLLLGNAPGNDMKLSEEKIAGFRNFTNKLWNIARFVLLNIEQPQYDIQRPKPDNILDKWILWELDRVVRLVNKWLENNQFSIAGDELQDFTWSILADHYLEYIKGENSHSEILNYVLNMLLKLWHPFMPFVTETIWQEIYGTNHLLMVERYPNDNQETISNSEIVFMQNLGDIISRIRALRVEYKIDVVKLLDLYIDTRTSWFLELENIIKKCARLSSIKAGKNIKAPDRSVSFVLNADTFYIDLSGAQDVEKEKVRISEDLVEAKKYLNTLEKKLSNEEFIKNAPEVVVNAEKEKLKLHQEKVQKLQNQLTSLQS